MPARRDLRLIEGGKGGNTGRAAFAGLPLDQLRERALQLRLLLSLGQEGRFLGMADDMDEAIGALGRLESSDRSDAPQRAAEYRILIAEIDAEILRALEWT